MIIGIILALVGLGILITNTKERGVATGAFVLMFGALIICGSYSYENAFSNCPCKVAIVDVNGKTNYKMVKAVWSGKYGQVYMIDSDGLHWYNSTQVRY
jgi:hypothetical protein